jgi:hypothetical protein
MAGGKKNVLDKFKLNYEMVQSKRFGLLFDGPKSPKIVRVVRVK